MLSLLLFSDLMFVLLLVLKNVDWSLFWNHGRGGNTEQAKSLHHDPSLISAVARIKGHLPIRGIFTVYVLIHCITLYLFFYVTL